MSGKSFMRSLVTDDLKVMLAGNDLTGGVKPGGSTTEGGGGQLARRRAGVVKVAKRKTLTFSTVGTRLAVEFFIDYILFCLYRCAYLCTT